LNEGNVRQTREGAQGQTFSRLLQTYEAGHAATLAALGSVRDESFA
jgi:hypothetical protein